MRSRTARRTEDLRLAVACLPVHTRLAMLEGIANNTIIAGAYTDRTGGVCPMLAAHRAGGRTDLIAFAHAWDRFTGARRRSRRATPHELAVLRAALEGSLVGEQDAGAFGTAIAEHQAAGRARRAAEAQHLPVHLLDEPAPAPAGERELV
jgi:hypothetical protein